MKSLFALALLLAPTAFAQKISSKEQVLEFTQQSTFCQIVFMQQDSHGAVAHAMFYCDNGTVRYNFTRMDSVTNAFAGMEVAKNLISPQLSVQFCGGGSGQRINCTYIQPTPVRNAPQAELSSHAAGAEFCYVRMEKGWFDPKRRSLIFECDNGVMKHPLVEADNILNEQAAIDWARSLMPEFKVIHCDYFFGGSCLLSR